MSIRVFVYDDHADRRAALKALLSLSEDFVFAGEAAECSKALDDIEKNYPDVVLMDINMPGVNGIEGLKLIKETYPAVKVLMQTAYDDSEKIFTCLKCGASGYILKTDAPQKLLQAIYEVYDGGAAMNPAIAKKVLDYFKPQKTKNPLSPKEAEVLSFLGEGLSYKMIADKMGISYNTVNGHVKNIYQKLHVACLGEAIAFYYKHLK
ncbi:MAG: response regulator transcription factor [Chitinophagaceae bacterium]